MLPAKYRNQVLKDTHEQTGHAGLFKFMHAIQEHCVWPGMRKEVQKFIDQCGLCQVNNARPVRPPMGEMPIATCPGHIVGIDLMGPLMESSLHQNRYLCVLIDHYSGWVEAYPLKTKSNEGIWERLANDYVPRHGEPMILISNQGSEFRGAGFEQWLEKNGIEHRRTSGYNPQSNGRTERANGTIRRMLQKLVNGESGVGRSTWSRVNGNP
jgi:transposase InsO family protein